MIYPALYILILILETLLKENMQLENPWEEGPSFELWFLVLHEAVHTAYVCGEKLKTHRRRKEGFGLTNHSSWQVLSAHKQPLPINL